jgi:hypothetical protein
MRFPYFRDWTTWWRVKPIPFWYACTLNFPTRSIHRLVVVFQVNNWGWVGGGGGWKPFN